MRRTIFILVILIIAKLGVNAQKGNIGAGIILGYPTGLSAKLWTGNSTAFDAAAAWSISGDTGALHLHASFLKHRFDILKVDQGQLPLYFGIGAKIVLADEPVVGARVPLGISYIFDDHDLPLDVFLELVPVLEVLPTTGFGFDGAIGVRYYF